MPHPVPGCSCCGGSTHGVDLDFRATLPDAIQSLPPEQRAFARGNKTFQRLDGVGAFVRCLMPIRLTGHSSVTYSVWLRVDDEQTRHAHTVWRTPEYGELRLRGEVANAVKPWPGLLGESAGAEVREPGHLPYLVADEASLLSRVLTDEWDRDDVLSRLPYPLPIAVRQQLTEEWSICRTDGLALRRSDDMVAFGGPGRTVQIEVFDVPAGTPVDLAIAEFCEHLPEPREHELYERDGELVRRAFTFTTVVGSKPQHELYGYAGTPGSVLGVTCMYDDPADLLWAQHVWRSARPG